VDLRDSPAEAQFRSALRAWLAANKPAELPADHGLAHAALIQWHRKLHEAGWIGLSWPQEYGGQGLDFMTEVIFQQEIGRVGAPNPPAYSYIARALLIFGTQEQKQRFLPGLLSGREQWCQGFSEPEAGSDLASLRTRAVDEGDHFAISGQKIWTSRAMFADFCFLLARTAVVDPPHAGITVFLVDMRSPGITVRPIREITGNQHHFAEVFFDSVRVPRPDVLGAVGEGWKIAQTTMTYERGPVDVGIHAELTARMGDLAGLARARGLDRDPALRRSLARAAVALEVLRLRAAAAITARCDGVLPGPEGSIEKVLMATTEQQILGIAAEILGPAMSVAEGAWYNRYLQARSATIYGGTIQIQKNILARRILKLGNA
jgi:alkylation response protein AidB-like acyl-CoA dehydrogenase